MKAQVYRSTLLCLLLSGAVQAADLDSCLAIEEPTARLACYDAAAGRTTRPTVAEPAAAASEFGMSERLKREKAGEPEKDPAPQTLVATISEAQRNSQGYFALTLDNRQRWYVSEVLPPLWFKAGDQVTIHRGSLGSFLLKRAKGGQALRVRRIE